jgi:hypothetical protein
MLVNIVHSSSEGLMYLKRKVHGAIELKDCQLQTLCFEGVIKSVQISPSSLGCFLPSYVSLLQQIWHVKKCKSIHRIFSFKTC